MVSKDSLASSWMPDVVVVMQTSPLDQMVRWSTVTEPDQEVGKSCLPFSRIPENSNSSRKQEA